MRVLTIPIMLFLIVGLCGCTSNQVNEKINNEKEISKEINTTENVKNTSNEKNEITPQNK